MAERLQSALRVYVFATLGVFLLFVPWTPVWDQALVTLLPPPAGEWLRSGWFRGVVCGLGVLDLFVAAREAGVLWRLLGKAEQR